MASLSSEAQNYEPPKTENISDLDSVDTNINVEEKEFTKSDGETFSMKVISVDGKDYRVPVSVLKSLKEILAIKPSLKTFKVQKSDTGMNTSYVVVPLE